MRHSLRRRLMGSVVVATTFVLAASCITIYARMRESLLAEFDAALGSKARALAALAEQDGEHIELELGERRLPEFERAQRAEYLQFWREGGEVLYRSPSLKGRDLSREAGPLEEPRCRSVVLPDGRRGRMAYLTFVPRHEHRRHRPLLRATLALARDTRDVDRTLARLRWLLIGVCAVATLVSAALLAWIVTVGLRPVKELAAQIEQVGEDDLSVRLVAEEAPSELAPVAERLNGLLERLEAAFARERAFSADVAHELRTPLAGLRATLEVALAGQRDLASFEEGLRDSLGITRQMHALVENLLALARSEAGQLDLARESVAADELLRECWAAIEEAAADRELRVEWQLEPPCALTTDREKLRLVLQNILGNAVAYANRQGHVRIGCQAQDGRVRVTVANSGSRISREQAEHVFERFWRGDPARADTGLHCGLGLTLCERLVVRLGGTIAVTSEAGGEFAVTVDLPASPGTTRLAAARRLR